MIRAAWKIPIILYAALLGLLYASIAAASILGMLRIYQVGAVVIFVVLVSIGVTWAYLRWGGLDFFQQLFQNGKEYSRKMSVLDTLLLVLGVILTIVLLVVPIAGFPYSPLMEKLNWDVGFYHFPKALELVVSGNVWDLSIAYGEYPFGAESLYSLAAVITRDTALFGTAHLLTVILFVVSFWFILRRFTSLPGGVTLFLTSLFMLSGALDIELNVWRIFKFLAFTIGKNDLFLGAAVLSAVLHAPIGSRQNQSIFNWVGFSISAMIAVSIKPNALFVILPLWLWLMIKLVLQNNRLSFQNLPWKQVGGSALIILPGLMWIPRNLIGQGALFSAEAGELQFWNLLNHLLTPNLLQTFPKTLWLVGGLLIAAILTAALLKYVSWSSAGMYVLLLAAFAVTPGSAVLNYWESQNQVVVAWRFGLALLAFGLIMILYWFSPWLGKIYRSLETRLVLSGVVSLAAVVFVGWFIYINSGVLNFNSNNAWLLRDPYRGDVGRDGYYSPINYIQREVNHSVVWVENGMSYYVYGSGFTNSTSRAQKASYLVILETNWDGYSGGYPDYISNPDWQKSWTLVYEDGEGRVYHRNP